MWISVATIVTTRCSRDVPTHTHTHTHTQTQTHWNVTKLPTCCVEFYVIITLCVRPAVPVAHYKWFSRLTLPLLQVSLLYAQRSWRRISLLYYKCTLIRHLCSFMLYMHVWVQNHTCAYFTEVPYVQTRREVLEVSKYVIINVHIIL